jgi:4-methyl-5(b-hydroxyethyl)-thiazole monophosphate biosynthesis
MATILIPIATGFEEIEAVTLIDVLRRANLDVIVASISNKLEVQGANGITILTDRKIEGITANDIDMILLPGGWGGTDLLATDKYVQNLLQDMNQKGKDISAICAAPYALKEAGVLPNNYTCYPSVEEKIIQDGYNSNSKIVQEGNIITSQGPGTAMCLALYIVKKYAGDETYYGLKDGLLANFCA